MSKKDINKLWLKVKKNHKTIDECTNHHFTRDKIGDDYRCTWCGGTVDISFHRGYKQGYIHGENKSN